MPDSSSWTTALGGIKVPPLQPLPSDVAKPGDALCDICRGIDFEPATFFIDTERGSRRPLSSGVDDSTETDGDGHSEDDDSIALSNDDLSNSPEDDGDEGDNDDDDDDDDGDDDDDEDDSSEISSVSFAQPFIELGKITDVRSRAHCPFCRLALAAVGGSRVPDVKNGEPVTLEISVIKNGAAAPGENAVQTRVLMASVSAGDEFVDEAAVFPEIVLVANDSPHGPVSLVRPSCQEKIDFRMVRNWLGMCESFHGDECRKRPGLDDFPAHPAGILKEFRFIDVEKGCLVRATGGHKYVALSYVWGKAAVLRTGYITVKSNVERLERPGAFEDPEISSQLPLTVKDAIQVTKEIGIRYLWVDALCIVQDDEEGEKLPHIKQMNRIYETAELVIVAMSSRDANTGLPGVRPWTRDAKQYIEQMTPRLRLGIRSSYGNDSVGGVYDTRGWTYQETCFARRQLVFTGGQAVFLCKYANNWSEDRFVEDAEFVLRETLESCGGGSAWDGDDDIRSYEGPAQNYSSRTLSFQSDVYAAFAGVAQRMRDLLNIDLCHGVPPRYFDWCLLWDPMGKQTRRQGTASWSWSGWEGGAFPRIWDWYSPKTQHIKNALRDRTWIIWYHRISHDSTACRLVWNWNPEDKRARATKNFYGGEIRRRFPTIDCSETKPTDRLLSSAPTYYPDILCDTPGSGFLQFWTVAVEFRLDTPASSDAGSDGNWFTDHTQLGIFGNSGRQLGAIQVSDAWLEASPGLPLTREFILLCEGRDERADDYEYDEEPGWKYKVMLLEWRGEYAERVAVGSIRKGDEQEGSPMWKEIILG